MSQETPMRHAPGHNQPQHSRLGRVTEPGQRLNPLGVETRAENSVFGLLHSWFLPAPPVNTSHMPRALQRRLAGAQENLNQAVNLHFIITESPSGTASWVDVGEHPASPSHASILGRNSMASGAGWLDMHDTPATVSDPSPAADPRWTTSSASDGGTGHARTATHEDALLQLGSVGHDTTAAALAPVPELFSLGSVMQGCRSVLPAAGACTHNMHALDVGIAACAKAVEVPQYAQRGSSSAAVTANSPQVEELLWQLEIERKRAAAAEQCCAELISKAQQLQPAAAPPAATIRNTRDAREQGQAAAAAPVNEASVYKQQLAELMQNHKSAVVQLQQDHTDELIMLDGKHTAQTLGIIQLLQMACTAVDNLHEADQKAGTAAAAGQATLEGLLRTQQQHMQQMQAQLEEAEHRQRTLHSQLSAAQSNAASLTVQLVRSQEQQATLAAELQEVRSNAAAEKHAAANVSAQELQAALAAAGAAGASQVQAAEQKLRATEERLEAAQSRAESLAAKVVSAEELLRSLQEQLDSGKAAAAATLAALVAASGRQANLTAVSTLDRDNATAAATNAAQHVQAAEERCSAVHERLQQVKAEAQHDAETSASRLLNLDARCSLLQAKLEEVQEEVAAAAAPAHSQLQAANDQESAMQAQLSSSQSALAAALAAHTAAEAAAAHASSQAEALRLKIGQLCGVLEAAAASGEASSARTAQLAQEHAACLSQQLLVLQSEHKQELEAACQQAQSERETFLLQEVSHLQASMWHLLQQLRHAVLQAQPQKDVALALESLQHGTGAGIAAELLQAINQAATQRAELALQVQTLQQALQMHSNDTAMMKSQLSGQLSQLHDVLKGYESASRHSDCTRSQLSSVLNAQDQSSTAAGAARAEVLHQALRSALAEREAASVAVASTSRTLAAVQEEHAHLAAECEMLQGTVLRLQCEAARSQQESSRWSQQVEQLHGVLTQLDERHAQLHDEHKAALSELSALKTQALDAEARGSEACTQVANLNIQLPEGQQLLETAQAQLRAAEERLVAAEAQHAHDLAEAMSASHAQCAALESHVQALSEQLAAAQRAADDVDAMAERLAAAEAAQNAAEQQLQALQAECTRLQAAVGASGSALEQMRSTSQDAGSATQPHTATAAPAASSVKALIQEHAAKGALADKLNPVQFASTSSRSLTQPRMSNLTSIPVFAAPRSAVPPTKSHSNLSEGGGKSEESDTEGGETTDKRRADALAGRLQALQAQHSKTLSQCHKLQHELSQLQKDHAALHTQHTRVQSRHKEVVAEHERLQHHFAQLQADQAGQGGVDASSARTPPVTVAAAITQVHDPATRESAASAAAAAAATTALFEAHVCTHDRGAQTAPAPLEQQMPTDRELAAARARVTALEGELASVKARLKEADTTLCKALDEAMWIAANEATSQWEANEVLQERDRLQAQCVQLQAEHVQLIGQALRAQAHADAAVVHACVVEMFSSVKRRLELEASLSQRLQQRLQTSGSVPARLAVSEMGAQCTLLHAGPMSAQVVSHTMSWHSSPDRCSTGLLLMENEFAQLLEEEQVAEAAVLAAHEAAAAAAAAAMHFTSPKPGPVIEQATLSTQTPARELSWAQYPGRSSKGVLLVDNELAKALEAEQAAEAGAEAVAAAPASAGNGVHSTTGAGTWHNCSSRRQTSDTNFTLSAGGASTVYPLQPTLQEDDELGGSPADSGCYMPRTGSERSGVMLLDNELAMTEELDAARAAAADVMQEALRAAASTPSCTPLPQLRMGMLDANAQGTGGASCTSTQRADTRPSAGQGTDYSTDLLSSRSSLPDPEDDDESMLLKQKISFYGNQLAQEEELQAGIQDALQRQASSGLSRRLSLSPGRTTLDECELSLGGALSAPVAHSPRLILVENPLSMHQLPADLLGDEGLLHDADMGAPMSPSQQRMLVMRRERRPGLMLNDDGTPTAGSDGRGVSPMRHGPMPSDVATRISSLTRISMSREAAGAPAGDTEASN